MRNGRLWVLLLALCVLFPWRDVGAWTGGGWSSSGGITTWTAALATPIVNPNWSATDWYVNGSTGNDSNSCTSVGSPCRTWHEINDHRWGCVGSPDECPRLPAQTTTLHLTGSQVAGDWIYFHGAIEGNGTFAIVGTPTQVATGSLAGVVALNRATPQLWNMNLGASAAVGQLVTNSTHSSVAWVYKLVSGTTFATTNPVTPYAVPIAGIATSVTTVANGDTFAVSTLPDALIADFSPVSVAGPGNAAGYIYRVNVNRVSGASLYFGGSASLVVVESAIGASETGALNAYGGYDFLNCDQYGPSANFPVYQFGGALSMWAGDVRNANPFNCLNCNPDEDFIIGTASLPSMTWQTQGNVYIDTGIQAQLWGNSQTGNTVDTGAASGTVWGPGALQLVQSARYVYPAGAGKAAATFKQTGAMSINGQTTVVKTQPTLVTVTTYALTAANLDTNNGAASACGAVISGGSFCNF